MLDRRTIFLESAQVWREAYMLTLSEGHGSTAAANVASIAVANFAGFVEAWAVANKATPTPEPPIVRTVPSDGRKRSY